MKAKFTLYTIKSTLVHLELWILKNGTMAILMTMMAMATLDKPYTFLINFTREIGDMID